MTPNPSPAIFRLFLSFLRLGLTAFGGPAILRTTALVSLFQPGDSRHLLLVRGIASSRRGLLCGGRSVGCAAPGPLCRYIRRPVSQGRHPVGLSRRDGHRPAGINRGPDRVRSENLSTGKRERDIRSPISHAARICLIDIHCNILYDPLELTLMASVDFTAYPSGIRQGSGKWNKYLERIILYYIK